MLAKLLSESLLEVKEDTDELLELVLLRFLSDSEELLEFDISRFLLLDFEFRSGN